MSYDAEAARIYEGQPEHVLPDQEVAVWLDLMRELVRRESLDGKVIDVGAGTGLLTAALKRAGLAVVGLEPSVAMIQQGIRSNPDLEEADFVVGQADSVDLMPEGQFDWVVIRQALTHLTDAETCFSVWRRWLRPGGHVVVVDGFWRRVGWTAEEFAARPFAGLTSATPVAETMERVGLEVLRAGEFDELNTARSSVLGETTTRYVVAARKR